MTNTTTPLPPSIPPSLNVPNQPTERLRHDTVSLPPMRERPFQRLPVNALWQMRLSALVTIFVLCVLLAVLLFGALPFVFADTGNTFPLSINQRFAIIVGMFFGFASLKFWLARLQYYYTGYRLDADGLAIRQGVLWRSETIALRTRVQHIDINRTPLSRAFGLAKINVYTAGTRLGKISLGGLALADAQYIRDQLISQENDTL